MIDQAQDERAIFFAALQRPAGPERDAFLREACSGEPDLWSRVRLLFSLHEESHGPLDSPAPGLCVTAAVDSPPAEQPGTHIGPYKLLEQIGEGGMGVVYVAEQTEPVRRRVALKIIKPGMDTKQVIARFEAERQALAMMDHPHIAKVLDAGTTDAGRPYFVMELVRGLPVTEYCDKARLSPRQRLGLFIDVCHAVQHAHQKGVIHRDLKPSNVMITVHDGRPVAKVIDFGVAKAVGQQLTERTVYTAHTQLVGTPMYMSPEQADFSSQDVDTRSDVYSLGVLLYELLTGQTPFDKETLTKAGFDEMRRIIREDEPPCPSRRFSTLSAQASSTVSQHRNVDERHLGRVLRGELDWIVMKALEKDRSRRYESASALAADIQRYLSDEPVLACPPTAMYRFQKFARKHKPALATAAAIALCLLLGTTVSAWQAVRATTAEAQAEVNEQKALANAAEVQERAKEATDQRDEAQKQRDEVRALNEKLQAAQSAQRRTLYAATMVLAQRAWEASDPDRVRELVNQQRPKSGEPDLRGFEWHYLDRLCHSDVLSISGGTDWVWNSVSFSPDGKRLAGGGVDGPWSKRLPILKIWDAQTGKELLTLKGHKGRVNSVAFSHDGKRLASAGDDAVKMWDTQTGGEEPFLGGNAKGAECLAFSPDGKRLATGSGGNTVKVWDAVTAQELLTLKGHTDTVGCVTFSPDGKRLAAGAWNGRIKVWDALSGDELLAIRGEGECLAFSPDGKRLANENKVFDAQTGKELLSLKDHTGEEDVDGNSVAFSPDGKRLAIGRSDRFVGIWDAQSGEMLFTYKGHSNRINSVAFSPDGTRLASAARDGAIKIWDATAAPEARTFATLAGSVTSIAFSPDGQRFATGAGKWSNARQGFDDGEVKVWDATSGKEVLAPKGHTSGVRSVAFSPDGQRLASAAEDKTVKVWETTTGRELLSFAGHAAQVVKVVFSPDGKWLASASADRLVKIWDSATGQELLTFKGHSNDPVGRANGLAISPDGKLVASTCQDSTKVWDAKTGQELYSLPGTHMVSGVAFSPDGKLLATTRNIGPGGAGEIKMCDANSGRELLSLKGHTAAVSSVSFSPDGKRLASSSGSPGKGEVKVWESETGQELLTLEGGGFRSGVAFSPDGKSLAAYGSHTVKIYDATPVPEKP